MKLEKKYKIYIAIIVILLIILAISVWARQAASPRIKINCQTACFQIGNNSWTFPGSGPISTNTFPTEEECVSACLLRTKQQ